MAPHPFISTPPPAGSIALTWINHASFLLQSSHGNFLIDPVYSDRCGPFGLFGPKRVHAPGVPIEELPTIHGVLLSHDHYDHCDLPTLRQLAKDYAPLAITPLGNGDLLARAGFRKVVELDWWTTHESSHPLRVTLTPSQHWSNRLSGARCSRLWGGFYLEFERCSIFFAGDTGYEPTLFKQIALRLGPPDCALLPIGAYEPRWFMKGQHCNPAEAVEIHRDLGARQSIAMHWGTFQLTDEAREDPPRALQAALQQATISEDRFRVLDPGETLVIARSPS